MKIVMRFRGLNARASWRGLIEAQSKRLQSLGLTSFCPSKVTPAETITGKTMCEKWHWFRREASPFYRGGEWKQDCDRERLPEQLRELLCLEPNVCVDILP